MPDSWDNLKEGDVRYFGFLKIDVIDHSALSRNMPSRTVEEVFDAFEDYVESKTESRGGRKWSWQGDGGLFAFYGDTDLLAWIPTESSFPNNETNKSGSQAVFWPNERYAYY